MKIISLAGDPHKRKHFDHFRVMARPHFGVTVNVDITDLLRLVRRSPTLRFTPAVVYLIGRAAMETACFRWRIRGEEIVEHAAVRPSFAVPTARQRRLQLLYRAVLRRPRGVPRPLPGADGGHEERP